MAHTEHRELTHWDLRDTLSSHATLGVWTHQEGIYGQQDDSGGERLVTLSECPIAATYHGADIDPPKQTQTRQRVEPIDHKFLSGGSFHPLMRYWRMAGLREEKEDERESQGSETSDKVPGR